MEFIPEILQKNNGIHSRKSMLPDLFIFPSIYNQLHSQGTLGGIQRKGKQQHWNKIQTLTCQDK